MLDKCTVPLGLAELVCYSALCTGIAQHMQAAVDQLQQSPEATVRVLWINLSIKVRIPERHMLLQPARVWAHVIQHQYVWAEPVPA
jgi:hypothetical protein